MQGARTAVPHGLISDIFLFRVVTWRSDGNLRTGVLNCFGDLEGLQISEMGISIAISFQFLQFQLHDLITEFNIIVFWFP